MHRRHPQTQKIIQASLELVHHSLDTYGLSKDSTILLGSTCLTCLYIRSPHDIDAMVSAAEFKTMSTLMATLGGTPLTPKLRTNQPWLRSIRTPASILPIDITRPTNMSLPDVRLDEIFAAELATLPQTEEGWRYLTAELSLDAMKSFGSHKNRNDIKALEKKITSQT